MCNRRYFDTLAIVVSILIGIALAVLSIFNLVVSNIIGPIVSLVFAALALLLLVLNASGVMHQDNAYAKCYCCKSRQVLISAMLLIAVAAFSLIFLLTGLIVGAILAFFMYTLLAYMLISLYCFIACITRAGCCNNDCACCNG